MLPSLDRCESVIVIININNTFYLYSAFQKLKDALQVKTDTNIKINHKESRTDTVASVDKKQSTWSKPDVNNVLSR